jgi:hypothetical protein
MPQANEEFRLSSKAKPQQPRRKDKDTKEIQATTPAKYRIIVFMPLYFWQVEAILVKPTGNDKPATVASL